MFLASEFIEIARSHAGREGFLRNGRLLLRLWLSHAPNVHSTLEARQTKYADVGAIRSTYGNYNQMLPAGISADLMHSVVIWCPTVLIAFSAAPLVSQRPS